MPSALDHPTLSERYFFPRPDTLREARVVTTRDGVRLRCGLWPSGAPSGGATPTVLHFHGNGEVVADWADELGPFFAACGWSLGLVEYRGYGGSEGQPALAAMLGDGEDVLRALGLDPRKTVAFGRSIGSLYAAELARRVPLAGLVLESGIHDLAERVLLRVTPRELGLTRDELLEEVALHFDQGAKLAAFEGPVLVLHARDDELVAFSHAERNARACARPLVCAFDRGGHNGIYALNEDAYRQAVRDFLAGLAPPG